MKKILHVEDNQHDQELLSLSIQRHAKNITIQIEVAESFSKAKQLIDDQYFDAVLIDWVLPDGDGSDVAAYARQKSKQVAIIFISGAITDEQMTVAQQYNVRAFLTKNFNQDYVDTLINLI